MTHAINIRKNILCKFHCEHCYSFLCKKKKVEQPNRTCFTLEYPLDQVRNKESSGNKDLQLIYKHLSQT